ncbi:MAG: YciI family protein [Myxococcota bacterium]
MTYALLIYMDEAELPPMEGERVEEVRAFDASLGGAFRGASRLQPASTATTQRVRGGKVLTTDGPFAETKEVLGGFYLVDCDDLDQALAIAARLPAARVGAVEVRPVH